MISVKELTKYYGDVHALKGINFEVKHGEIVGILGPNGAGKSTTLRILTCYLNPTGGDAIIDGKSILNDTRAIKRTIGYLPESAPLYNDMIVYDYLIYMALIQEVKKEDVSERLNYVVKACNLKEVISKTIGELSKGYKQRVGLAGAIIHDPKILILDEPTNGLDPNQIVEIRELIKDLGKEKTVLLSTHILSEVEATCSRVIIINKGEIITDSTPEELTFHQDGGMIIRLSLKTSDSLDNVVSTIKKSAAVSDIKTLDSLNSEIKNMIITFREKEARETLYNVIKNTNWVIYEMIREKEDLETVFQTLTRGDK